MTYDPQSNPLRVPIPQSWLQATWFVDPANSTGLANDDNNGIDALHPVLSYNGGIVRKWGTIAPMLAQNTNITWLSSQPAPPAPPDPVILEPIMQGAVLTVQGVLGAAQEVSTGTIGVVTAKNRATPQLLDITTSATIAPVGTLVKRTAAAGGGISYAWVYISEAANKAQMTQPLVPAVLPLSTSSSFAEENGWALGDMYAAYAPVLVNIVKVSPTISEYDDTNFPCQVQLNQLTVSSADGVTGDNSIAIGNDVTCSECLFNSLVIAPTLSADDQEAYFSNCFLASGVFDASGSKSITYVYAGVVFEIYAGLTSWSFDNDAIIDGSSQGMTVGASLIVGVFPCTFGSVYLAGVISAQGSLVIKMGGVVWGPGTLDATGTARIAYPPPAMQSAAATFLQTGGLKLNQQANANAFNPGTGLWSASIAINAANLDLAFGAGGFGGLAVNVGGGCYTAQGTP